MVESKLLLLIARLVVISWSVTLVSAANNIYIQNSCSYPIWYWSVFPSIHTPDSERNCVPAGSTGTHAMAVPINWDGGISLKMRDLPNYEVAPAGIIQAEYSIRPPWDDIAARNKVFYDLSFIDCTSITDPTDPNFCPFAAAGVSMTAIGDLVDDGCEEARCQLHGAYGKCQNTYREHGSWPGEPTFSCPVGVDFIIKVCTESDGVQSIPPEDTSYTQPEEPWQPPPYDYSPPPEQPQEPECTDDFLNHTPFPPIPEAQPVDPLYNGCTDLWSRPISYPEYAPPLPPPPPQCTDSSQYYAPPPSQPQELPWSDEENEPMKFGALTVDPAYVAPEEYRIPGWVV